MKARTRLWLEVFAFFNGITNWYALRTARVCGCPRCLAFDVAITLQKSMAAMGHRFAPDQPHVEVDRRPS